ncbi:serine hydrolase domain-containing protein [Pseudactinotalea sp. Z1739]|uniref:serine hydrolase domain-containing protein n=1 Tax=Pseudactinotalea sp. Z1739 TaxID=3413028 RepID=UPI003C7E2B3C
MAPPAGAPQRRRRPWIAASIGVVLAAVLAGCAALQGAPVNPPPAPAAAPSAADAAASLTAVDTEAWLDGFLPAALEREGVAGAAVSVVHEGEVVTERGYGYADTGAGSGTGSGSDDPASAPQPVEAQRTLFRVGSISKVVVGIAVMQLVEEGAVSLDHPVADYIDLDIPTTYDEPITLRHLLSHTAGFEERLAGVFLDPAGDVPPLREVLADPPRQIYAPGTTPSYTNYSNALAGYVVERVSGMNFADYAAEHVFTPAGMSTATFAQPLPTELAEQMSGGYPHLRAEPAPFELVGLAPAGAMSATTADMSALMLTLLAAEDGDPGSQVLSPESLRTMAEPAFGADTLGGLAGGPRTGLGLYELDRNGQRIVGHGGDTYVFHAEMQIYPETGTGIYIGLNSSGVGPMSTAVIRDQLVYGFTDRYFPDTRTAPEPTATAAEHAQVLAGSYMTTRGVQSNFVRVYSALVPVTISATGDGTLTMDALVDASGSPRVLVEVEPWVWQEVGGQQRLGADVVDGQVRAVGLHPAIALEPLPATLALVPWVLVGTSVVLVVGLLGRPVAALVRRRYRGRLQTSREDRWLRLACTVGAAVALLAVGLWAVVAAMLMGSGGAPALLIRVAQLLTLVAVLAVIPAGMRLVGSLRRRRWWSAGSAAFFSLAFAGLGYVAVVGRLLSLDITY